MFVSTAHAQKKGNLPQLSKENVCVHHKIKQTQAFRR